jgi:hypothetical protein
VASQVPAVLSDARCSPDGQVPVVGAMLVVVLSLSLFDPPCRRRRRRISYELILPPFIPSFLLSFLPSLLNHLSCLVNF